DPVTIEAHTNEALPPYEETVEYYHDLLQIRHVERELKRQMKLAADLLGTAGKDPMQALEIMAETERSLVAQRSGRQITDFREAYDLIIPDYAAKFSAEQGLGIRFGWPTLDEMTGGLVPKDMVSIVGRPSRGKTQALLYASHYSWKRQE